MTDADADADADTDADADAEKMSRWDDEMMVMLIFGQYTTSSSRCGGNARIEGEWTAPT